MDNQETQQNKEKDQDEHSKGKTVSDVIKRLFAVGSTAAFLTEESIKTALGDIKLPKELLKPLLASAMSSKQQIFQRVSKEVSSEMIKILNSEKFKDEVFKFLRTHKFKINIEIESNKDA